MQVATVSLEILSEFCSQWDFSRQNKSAAPAVRNGKERRQKRNTERREGKGKGGQLFLMMKDEENRYHRKQSCKYSLLHTQFSEKDMKNLQGSLVFTYLLTDSLHPV